MPDEPIASEQATGEMTAKAIVGGVGFRKNDNQRVFFSKELTYAQIAGRALFEGDICLGTPGKPLASGGEEGHPTGVGIPGERYRWIRGIMPYAVAPALSAPSRITAALKHWTDRTGIRFVERTTANKDRYPDYVQFVDRGGCWSMVGRRGGVQELSVGPDCSIGNVIHEVGHALGLWHEQSRADRLRYVRIRPENIDLRYLHNFLQHILDGDDLGAYDYGSIMHYPKNAFSRNGQSTIEPLQPNVQIGQRESLSAGDCAAIGQMYRDQLT
jgi:hypothetical protein